MTGIVRNVHTLLRDRAARNAQWRTCCFEMSVLRQLGSRVYRITPQLPTATFFQSRPGDSRRNQANAAAAQDSTWTILEDQGYDVNPCGSWHHPAVKAGLRPADNEKSLQEAYTPASSCFGCGMQIAADSIYLDGVNWLCMVRTEVLM